MTNCNTLEWERTVLDASAFSSPKCVDLNDDGIKDIVLGAGGTNEWKSSENGVLAFNGKNGELLWKAPCRNHVFGCPAFVDVNGDGQKDVVIGGRSAQLMALEGSTGKILWEYLKHHNSTDYKNDTDIMNFYTPIILPDKDGDGVQDLLVSYGGFVKAAPGDPDRPPGFLKIMSGKTGQVLAKAPMPDGKETYMSPVMDTLGNKHKVYFGTGGETISGNFYVTDLEDIMDGEITEHKTIATATYKGFIAPPVLVDLNKDSVLDVVVNAYEGKTQAYDGKTYRSLWEFDAGLDYEIHCQPSIGQFTGDGTPDFFINYNHGEWPYTDRGLQVLIDGNTGKHTKLDSIGLGQFTSPISISPTSDKKDQVLFSINRKEPTDHPLSLGLPSSEYRVDWVVFSPGSNSYETIRTGKGLNMAASVLLDDLNDDGVNELIMVHNLSLYDIIKSKGTTVMCWPFEKYTSEWNQYMGKGSSSIYDTKGLMDN